MSFVFSVDKAVQAAGLLLKLQPGRRMAYIKLIKLLYIADREALRDAGFPITGDKPFAMKHGPVLSRIYDLIKGEAKDPGEQHKWSRLVFTQDNDVVLVEDTPCDELSDFEIEILIETNDGHGAKWHWFLRDETHRFPEWKNNFKEATSTPIPLADILKAVGREADFDEIERERIEEERFEHNLKE